MTVLLTAGSVAGVTAIVPGAAPLEDARQGQPACDYQSLFDETAGSVVSIRTSSGQSSGFVYEVENGTDTNATDDTYVVTNAHVVSGAAEVEVEFEGSEFRSGSVVGHSTYADLAVVSVSDPPAGTGALSLADTDPQRGERVAALGNPFGLDETISHGIVSGLNRTLPTRLGFEIPNVVQTDAPISPGNSGGPLVNCDGDVVGVNTAGIARQGAENIGFAVSPSVVERVVPELLDDGEFDYPYIGVRTTPVTPTIADGNDLDRTTGLAVVSVLEDGPSAGALQGPTEVETVGDRLVPTDWDLILAIDGQQLRSGEALGTYLVTETRPGDTVDLTVLRDGDVQRVQITVGERPDPVGA
ncbi:trypsin-like peptidase domain-containing protein [Halosimplex litoreum]|uniref:Trypsin-like peptidase domain-containing protein n=1 Tax=Halosimplex litoreum TaxID=1198301 RepID=A0A7U3WT86_9EURY|nr:trypsin-like peptidase domain-containing protein [Halosimplex litoreum]